jgi:hypothetical protein
MNLPIFLQNQLLRIFQIETDDGGECYFLMYTFTNVRILKILFAYY